MTFEEFKKSKKTEYILGSIKNDILANFETLSWKLFTENDYNQFVKNKSYPKKDFDNFYNYVVDHLLECAILSDSEATIYNADTWETTITYTITDDLLKKEKEKKGLNNKSQVVVKPKEKYRKDFEEFILEKTSTIIRDFLETEYEKGKIYSNLMKYIKHDCPYIFDAVRQEDIEIIYGKLYQEYEQKHGINKFGLETEYADRQLETILNGGVGDGTFLYSWKEKDPNTGKIINNWINKYESVIKSKLYKEIELAEDEIYEYIFGGDITLSNERTKRQHDMYPFIYNIIHSRKRFVEMGPWWVKKLLDYLKEYLSGAKSQKFREQKVVKLVDKAGEAWYKSVMDAMNEYAGGKNIAEWIDTDFSNKESTAYEKSGSCYFMFWGTIGNFTSKEIKELLDNMKSKQTFQSNISFITYFTAPDENTLSSEKCEEEIQKIKARYGDMDPSNTFRDETGETHQALSDFILSWFVALGIPRDKLEYVVEYEKGWSKDHPAKIKVGAKFIENVTIPTSKGKITKKKDEYIRAIQSARFTDEQFKEVAKQSWHNVMMQESTTEKGVGVAVLKSKRWINDTYKKPRNIIWSLLIWGLLLWWWLLTKNILHQREMEKQQEKMDTEFASKQKMSFNGDMGHGYYELTTTAEKIEYINKLIDALFENISIRYDLQTGEDEIKDIIRSYIKDKEILGKFANTDNYNYNIFDISDAFVKKYYSDVLIKKDIDKMPYDHLKDYETYFKELIINTNMTNENVIQIYKGPNGAASQNKYLMSPTNISIYSDIQLRCIKSWMKRELIEEKERSVEWESDLSIKSHFSQRTNVESYSVKDGYLYVKKWRENPYNYVIATTQNGEERKNIDVKVIAYDYFYQNRPIIHEVYKTFGAIYWDMSSNSNREKYQTYRWKKDSVKMMITKDLLQTWLLDQISPDNERAILMYLQGFVQRNASFLEKEWISKTPYDAYQKEHGEAFENTSKANENNIPNIIGYEKRREDYKFQYIGKYYTQKGIEYDLGEVIIDWKKYLYARNIIEDEDEYHTEEWMTITLLNYYLTRGKEVVKDYHDLKKKTQ